MKSLFEVEKQNIAGHCQQTFEYKQFVDITKQGFASTLQVNFPAHNLNFHWRWRWSDWIQAIFLNIFYFTYKPINDKISKKKSIVLFFGSASD